MYMKRATLVWPLASAFVALVSAGAWAAGMDGATITNSGSTNTSGYIIKVRSDGTGTVQPTRRPQIAMPRRLAVPAGLAQKLLADAKAADHAGAAGQTCMKSASFGYSLTVRYHGWMSPDLACPGDDALAALRTDVQALEETAGLTGSPRPIRLPPEPRRLPNDVVSPSPSALPTASATTRPERQHK